MSARELSVVVDGMTYTECPRWHEGRLWFSDLYSQRVLAVVPGGEPEDVASVPQQPSGLGWLPDGRLLIVSMRDRKVLRQEAGGELVEHADLNAVATWHLNDMVVSPTGAAYVGNFGFDLMSGAPLRATPLARVDADGTVSVASEPLYFPNGSAITPDGSTLIVSESFGNRISAFDVGTGGELGPRRDWANLGPPPASDDLATVAGGMVFGPDGMCLDADGAVWVADTVGSRVIRLVEGGEILDQIAVGTGVFACMLGGDDGRTLFMCTAPDFHEATRAAARDAQIVAATVDVPHAGTP